MGRFFVNEREGSTVRYSNNRVASTRERHVMVAGPFGGLRIPTWVAFSFPHS
jgi:hypothetical protein